MIDIAYFCFHSLSRDSSVNELFSFNTSLNSTASLSHIALSNDNTGSHMKLIPHCIDMFIVQTMDMEFFQCSVLFKPFIKIMCEKCTFMVILSCVSSHCYKLKSVYMLLYLYDQVQLMFCLLLKLLPKKVSPIFLPYDRPLAFLCCVMKWN